MILIKNLVVVLGGVVKCVILSLFFTYYQLMSKAIDALNIYCKNIYTNDFDSAKLICSCSELYNDNKEKLKNIKKLYLKNNVYEPLGKKILINRTVRRFLADFCGLHKIVMINNEEMRMFRCGFEFGIMYHHISEQYNHNNEFLNRNQIKRNKIYLAMTYMRGNLTEKQLYIKEVRHVNELLEDNILPIIKKYIKKNLKDGFLPVNIARSNSLNSRLENGYDSDEYIDYSNDFTSGDDSDYPFYYIEKGNCL